METIPSVKQGLTHYYTETYVYIECLFQLLSAKQSKNSLLELGPVALDFEVSGYVCSGLQIRFIRVCERGQSYVPIRWLRYISVSDSYLVKI